jgi:molybdopterin-guanine dinucleotide biosynthesis protein A
VSTARLNGLVLAGGQSSRMKRDKAALLYAGKTQLERACELLARHTESCYVSVRESQLGDPLRSRFPLIVDAVAGEGPMVGIRSALRHSPDSAWLVLACDLPFVTDDVLSNLIRQRDVTALATAYLSSSDSLPEPLCAIWEPAAGAGLDGALAEGRDCPRKFLLRNSPVRLLSAIDTKALDNVNTPDDYSQALDAMGHATCN